MKSQLPKNIKKREELASEVVEITNEVLNQIKVRKKKKQTAMNLRMPKSRLGRGRSHHLSARMKDILLAIGNGIERSELLSRIWKLERRYKGYYTDPCFSKKEQREYDKANNSAQPTLTKALIRLEEKGLVVLQRPGKVVKRIELTDVGEEVVRQLEEEPKKE